MGYRKPMNRRIPKITMNEAAACFCRSSIVVDHALLVRFGDRDR